MAALPELSDATAPRHTGRVPLQLLEPNPHHRPRDFDEAALDVASRYVRRSTDGRRPSRALPVYRRLLQSSATMRLTKKQSRDRWNQLRDLVAAWDPLGLIEIGSPRDEYDCLLGPLMRHLEEGAADNVIAVFLANEFTHHFGLPRHADEPDLVHFSQTAAAWFSDHWSVSSV